MTARVSGTADTRASTALSCENYNGVLWLRIFSPASLAGIVDRIGEPPPGGSHESLKVTLTHRRRLPCSMPGLA